MVWFCGLSPAGSLSTNSGYLPVMEARLCLFEGSSFPEELTSGVAFPLTEFQQLEEPK